MRERIVRPVEAETGRAYELSFLKTSNGVPPPVEEGVHYEGFHLDTHPEITGERGPELARILVNLALTPRSLRFADADRFELSRRGVPVSRGDYQVVDLPADVATRLVEIPPFGFLRFWASVFPHVGADRPGGHFLASYEAVAPYPAAA